MTPDDLLSWQKRLGISGVEAARQIGVPYKTYRNWLPGGRRHQNGLPEWLAKLCGYLERDRAGTTAAEVD